MKFELKMPDFSTTGSPIKILRWLVSVGEFVERGQAMLEVETDKATMEVEALNDGTLLEQIVPVGQEASAGEVLAILGKAEASTGERVLRQASGQTAGPKKYEREFLLGLYRRMLLIRQFEDRVKSLFLEGIMPGTIHQCQGQEATAVGVCAALQENDFITSTFRGHGHALAKGLTVQEMLDELFGASTGCCKGKGGSMHMGNLEKGMVPGIAIVAGGIPLATGGCALNSAVTTGAGTAAQISASVDSAGRRLARGVLISSHLAPMVKELEREGDVDQIKPTRERPPQPRGTVAPPEPGSHTQNVKGCRDSNRFYRQGLARSHVGYNGG